MTDRRRLVVALVVLGALLAGVAFTALFVGSAGLAPRVVVRALAGRTPATVLFL